MLPCLFLPLEDASYSLWISGVHGSLKDTIEVFMEIGIWTPQKLQSWGCLCLDWLSLTHSAVPFLGNYPKN